MMARSKSGDGDSRGRLDSLLRNQAPGHAPDAFGRAVRQAEAVVAMENCIAVVSNLAEGSSRIIAGKFADTVGLTDYVSENSIWERKILSMMTEEEQQRKFIAELRFFHYLRKVVASKRDEYYLSAGLRFCTADGRLIDVAHRMYYVYDPMSAAVAAAICLYVPLTFGRAGKSFVVNSVTGLYEELTHSSDSNVLSSRCRQVLSLIDSGMKSSEIAAALNISVHTVNRHRQAILESLNVKNSYEACRIAKSMSLI